MSFRSWLQNLRSALAPGRGQRQHRRRGSLRAATHRLSLEVLEDRSLPTFIAPIDYAVGLNPQAVVTADFNNDGQLDLATANADSNTVSVLLGNVDGTFQPALNSLTGPNPQSLAIADFNGDRQLDLATANADYDGTGDDDVSILLGNGDGTFAAVVTQSIPILDAFSWSIAAGNLDTDTKLDLVVTSIDSWGDYVSVLLGHGDGTFAPPVTYGDYLGSLDSPTLADVNNDGNVDVAVAAWYSVKIFLGNGDGTLQQPRDFATDMGSDSLAAADYNADGILDLATANYFSGVSVLLGRGDGTFQAAQSFAAGANPTSAVGGDVSGDGALDLIVASAGGVSVLLGFGDGSFASPITSAAGTDPASVVVADFNADGRPDAAAANAGSSTVSVLLNDGAWRLPDLPRISISDVTKAEGKKGKATLFTLTVVLSTAFDQPVTVSYRTVDGTAKAGEDYVAKSDTLTFAPGETTKTITIEVKGDSKKEASETFYLDLFDLSGNALFTKSRGLGTILNDD